MPLYETTTVDSVAAHLICQVIYAQVSDVMRFTRLSWLDGALWLLTFVTVVVGNLDIGLAVGVAGSLAILFLHGVTPYTCRLQPLPATDIYVDTKRYANTVSIKGIQVLSLPGGPPAPNFAVLGNLSGGWAPGEKGSRAT